MALGMANSSVVRPTLKALTTLRFLAALHVVLFHMRVIGILPGGPWGYQNFASIGYIGVNLFFVLSGFILVYTYANSAVTPWRFWQARFARIYPAYLLSLVVSAPFFFFSLRHLDIPFLAWSKQHVAAACILTVSLLQSWFPQAALTWNAVCWTLSVEAFFYLAFPLLLVWSKEFTPKTLFCGIAGWSLLSLSISSFISFCIPMASIKSIPGKPHCSGKTFLALIHCCACRSFSSGCLQAVCFGRRGPTDGWPPRWLWWGPR